MDSFTPLIRQARESRDAAKRDLSTLQNQMGQLKEEEAAAQQRKSSVVEEARQAEARRGPLSGQVQRWGGGPRPARTLRGHAPHDSVRRRKGKCREAADAMAKAMEDVTHSRARLDSLKQGLARLQQQLQSQRQAAEGDPSVADLDQQFEDLKPSQRNARQEVCGACGGGESSPGMAKGCLHSAN